MEFKLSSVAKSDVLEITDYYADISVELAEGFVTELETTLRNMCLQPGLGSLRYAHFLPDKSLRLWRLDRFPFLLFYRIDGVWINVLRVLHERRDISADLITE
ncbi:MAG TPA: type II toxin-antitoxin system RelE/ParE family toxin [Duganella sp.]|nr:type II toxin-antitoxin system RelE/ParE family toxin [Duganella sp.]